MTREEFEELVEKRNFSLKAVLTLGITALPLEFWGIDTRIGKGTVLDQGIVGIFMRIASFIILTVPFMLIMFIINVFKLIYYQAEINKLNKTS